MNLQDMVHAVFRKKNEENIKVASKTDTKKQFKISDIKIVDKKE
jgi:hypothetical protein